MQKNKNTKLSQRPYQLHKSVSIMLKAQVQATSPRSFRTKKRITSIYKVLSTSVECLYTLMSVASRDISYSPLLYHPAENTSGGNILRWQTQPADNQVLHFDRATASRGRVRLGTTPTVQQSHMPTNILINTFIWRKSVLIIRIISLAYHSPGVTANRRESASVIKLQSSSSSVFTLIVLLGPFIITGRHNSCVSHCYITIMNISDAGNYRHASHRRFSGTTVVTDTTVGIWFCITQASLPTSELRLAGSSSSDKPSKHITFGFMTNLSIHFSDTTAVTDPALCSTSGLSQMSLSAGGLPPAISINITDITVCS